MVVCCLEAGHADRVFQALADATRRDILARVLRADVTVSGLARHYPVSFAAIQKHVAVLERAELVTKERRGRERLVRGNAEAIRRARRLLDELEVVWRDRVDRIEAVLADPDRGADR
ncbi:MAG: winged helix-turn-helix transcriptional regulator [Actinobacteria bacterium]|nr:winged helix-turn-helix transcriptional regulator [Actinomycetota bacterium]